MELVDDPQPVLRERQRNDRGPRNGRERRQPSDAHADTRRQLGNRRCIEESADSKTRIQGTVDRRHYPHGQQRVATKVEERLVDTDPLEAEHMGEDAGDDLFDRRPRSPVVIVVDIGRRGQGLRIELAVDGQWQRLESDYRGGHHVGRQPLRRCRTYPGQVQASGDRLGDVTHQPFVAWTILPDRHYRLFHPIDLGQRGGHLTTLDAIAADLDLLVRTPHVDQVAIGAPAHQVSGAVHACSWRSRAGERTGHKPRRRQPHPAHIADPDAAAGHVQLAYHPDGHRTQPPVQDEQGNVGQRQPDRADNAVGVGLEYLSRRDMHGRLRDPVEVQQAR